MAGCLRAYCQDELVMYGVRGTAGGTGGRVSYRRPYRSSQAKSGVFLSCVLSVWRARYHFHVVLSEFSNVLELSRANKQEIITKVFTVGLYFRKYV